VFVLTFGRQDKAYYKSVTLINGKVTSKRGHYCLKTMEDERVWLIISTIDYL
jgi:hypothetical protein